MVAELLGYPQVNVVKLEIGEGKVTAHREIEGARRGHRDVAAGGHHGAEGAQRAALRVAEGHHGREEEPLRETKLADLGVADGDPATRSTIAQARAPAKSGGR